MGVESWQTVVIGAGQAGLATSYHLQRRGITHVVLDANTAAGGAWQHRWDELTMADVHGIADLPGLPAAGLPDQTAPARVAVPALFAAYEAHFALPVRRPVQVRRVTNAVAGESHGLLRVTADKESWLTHTVVNATGTWTQPWWPSYPGASTFGGDQFHTRTYPGTEALAGRRVLVIGGGASAVQFLGALAPVAEVFWVTRRPPQWRTEGFGEEGGREAVARVEQRVRHGLPPQSVVSVTGLMLRPQEEEARRDGVYDRRRPMFATIEPDGVRWADGSFLAVDTLVWATGFRPALGHLADLHLRSEAGGIQLDHAGTTAVADPRIQLVGYGPSASTIGANRAGRFAARGVAQWLEGASASLPEPGGPFTS